MRKLIVGCMALIASAAMTSAAWAECRIMRFTFHLNQNESLSTTGMVDKGKRCTMGFRSFSVSRLTSASIVSRPSHGALTEIAALRFRYAPSGGFTGLDRYTIRICGTGAGGPGCATITYNITVQ